MIAVECEVSVLEIDGKDVPAKDNRILVANHRTYDDRVVLKVGGQFYTLSAKDVQAAVENCTNTAKW